MEDPLISSDLILGDGGRMHARPPSGDRKKLKLFREFCDTGALDGGVLISPPLDSTLSRTYQMCDHADARDARLTVTPLIPSLLAPIARYGCPRL